LLSGTPLTDGDWQRGQAISIFQVFLMKCSQFFLDVICKLNFFPEKMQILYGVYIV
jgi:hypothetical protein